MTNLEMNQNIADFIGRYCAKWNLSVSKFSEKCNIPYMTIKRIMACNVQKIDVYTISRIAQATNTPITEILGMEVQNMELYKRLTYATPRDRGIISRVMTILEKLHISGNECRQLPFTDLYADEEGYLLDPQLFSSEGVDYSKMQKISFRSSYQDGFSYFGFRLPDNRLHPYYNKGEVLMTVNDEPAHGDIGVFAWKDEGYIRLIFRRVEKKGRYTELVPINGLGKTYVLDNENVADLMNWVKIGILVGIVR